MLYVDEVNLLPDHLVDVLLDVAVSGINRVEREGVSHTHPSRFVLIGSMNPEEGDLRPQLLDRFGLAADVLAPADPAERAEAVRRRMVFDADPAAFAGAWPDEPLPANLPAALPDELVHRVSALCASVGAEGLRADLVICRAASALAGLEGRGTTTVEDVRRVAPLALAHRRRRQPFDDSGMAPNEIDQASRKWMDSRRGAQEGTDGDPADRMRPAVGADVVEKIDGRGAARSAAAASAHPREAWARRRRWGGVPDRLPEHAVAPPPWSMPSSPPWASRNRRRREGTPA